MFARIRRSLELRMVILAGSLLLGAFVLFAGLSLWAVDDGVHRALEERRLLARSMAERVSEVLGHCLDVLEETSLGAEAVEGAPVRLDTDALHDVARLTLFSTGVYVLDVAGRRLQAEPPGQETSSRALLPYVQQTVEDGRPIVTDLYATAREPVFSLLIPIRNHRGKVVAVLGGDMSATDRRLAEITRDFSLGGTGCVQVVDARGQVLAGPQDTALDEKASQQAKQLAAIARVRRDGIISASRVQPLPDGSGERVPQVVAFAAVKGSNWSVLIRQDEAEALLPTTRLRRIILFLGLPMLLLSMGVAWGTARSVVRPLDQLAHAAETIAQGDLSTPVDSAIGPDEVGRLARTFETMRRRLQESMERVRGWNAQLEARVKERTRQLEEQQHARRELLHKVITAQEEERRRIARELHDETCQSIAALILALDTAAMSGDVPAARSSAAGRVDLAPRLQTVRDLAVRILDGVHKVIYDLRPSLLDDLGLAAAVRWYAESRLGEAGVGVSVEISGEEGRLPVEVETAVFRAVQEAITNVARHAQAESALVRLEIRDEAVVAEVEDDGRGFDPTEVVVEDGGMRGLGLMGMKERIGLLEGRVDISSRRGDGTRVRFEVPLHPTLHPTRESGCGTVPRGILEVR